MHPQAFDTQKKVGAGVRLASMILDHIFMTIIAVLFGLPMFVTAFVSSMDVSHDQTEFNPSESILLYVFWFGISLYFCKDCIQGRSLAKRIIRLQVIDKNTGEVASPIRCFLRNILIVIWPIEVIVTLINPSRRLGDFVAGTRIEHYNPEYIDQPRAFNGRLLIPIVLSFGLFSLALLPFKAVNMSSTPRYIESSYNPAESKEIETLFADSLGTVLNASVRVYDKVEKGEVKYVSIVCTLKENYLEDEGTSKLLKDYTKELLYSKFPENTISGRAKYIYRQHGSFQSTSIDLGRAIH